MKKIEKIVGLITLFVLNFYNRCFADLVWIDENDVRHGGHPTIPKEPKTVNYVLIGILVLVVVVCAAIIISRIIKKKKERENDINN